MKLLLSSKRGRTRCTRKNNRTYPFSACATAYLLAYVQALLQLLQLRLNLTAYYPIDVCLFQKIFNFVILELRYRLKDFLLEPPEDVTLIEVVNNRISKSC